MTATTKIKDLTTAIPPDPNDILDISSVKHSYITNSNANSLFSSQIQGVSPTSFSVQDIMRTAVSGLNKADHRMLKEGTLVMVSVPNENGTFDSYSTSLTDIKEYVLAELLEYLQKEKGASSKKDAPLTPF